MANPQKTAFITGATGDIGAAVAGELDAQGYLLWLSGRNRAALEALKQKYPDAILTEADLADPDTLETVCMQIEDFDGTLDVALINAGVVIPGHVTDTTRSSITTQINLNLTASALLSQACAKKMKSQGHGHVLNTLSAAATTALPGSAAYSASKFGMRGFVLSMAAELEPEGIHVTAIYPNAVDTQMLREEAASGGSTLNFLSTPVTAQDVADAVMKALQERKLEYFVPASDRFVARVASSFPGLMRKLYPTLEKRGVKGRDAYLRKHNLTLKDGH